MAASKSSGLLRLSSPFVSIALCLLLSAAAMAASVVFVFRHGYTLYYGDAEAHLNIARRVIDSRTPGWYQVGTVWLPLPHLLMLPWVGDDRLWTTGLAGAIPAAACMTLAAVFLFATLRRLWGAAAAAGGTAVFLLNPNILYLGAIPMTEPVFFATLCALLYFTVRFADTGGWGALLGASLAAVAGTWTRYEGWMLLPFVGLYILFGGPRRCVGRRITAAAIFSVIAAAGPLAWLVHNRVYFGSALYFYNGPYSAIAIQGKTPYPGRGDWATAAYYFFTAGTLIAGWPGIVLGAAGTAVACLRRAWWPALLLLLPCIFYVMSIHSSGVPLFIPTLWPHSFYNSRYATAFLPVVALGVAAVSCRWKYVAPVAAFFALSPFAIHFSTPPVTWQESEINSRARRQWTEAAANYLRANRRPGEGVFTVFGDMTGIYRSAAVPLRDTLTGNNVIQWAEVTTHPDFFLREDWAVVTSGDELQTMLDRLRRHSPRYELEQRIMVKGAPVIEIYRRGPDPLPPDLVIPGEPPTEPAKNENSLP